MRISDWSSDVCSSDLRINGEVRCHPARIVELRDQTDIRQCHFRTSKKSCGTSHRLKSCKPRLDQVTCPCIDGFLVQTDLLPKMFEHPQHVDWMDITGVELGHERKRTTLKSRQQCASCKQSS